MSKATREHRGRTEAEVVRRSSSFVMELRENISLPENPDDFAEQERGSVEIRKFSGTGIVLWVMWEDRLLLRGRGRASPAHSEGFSGCPEVRGLNFKLVTPADDEVLPAIFISKSSRLRDDVSIITVDMEKNDSLTLQVAPGMSLRITFREHDGTKARFSVEDIKGDLPSVAQMNKIIAGKRAF